MNKVFSINRFVPYGLAAILILGACSQEPETAAQSSTSATGSASQAQQQNGDVIARVEDQAVTFSEINTMLNSAAVVGLSIPALGTPDRDTVRIVLLDKMIDANLVYLDALRKGVDKQPEYRNAITRFTRGMLAELYQESRLGDISVSDEEIETYHKETIVPGTELTDDLRLLIGSVLRKQKIEQKRTERREQLREGADIKIYADNFQLSGDDERADEALVAEVNGEAVSWGEMKGLLIAAGTAATHMDPLAMESDARLTVLQREIDTRLMAQTALAAGSDKDSVYQARLREYKKSRLINIHRANLAREMEPTDAELEAFFNEQGHRITIPEFRRVQMVVLASEEEAKDIKRRVEVGEMTMHEAASRHSIEPNAKKDLGDIGWVQAGKLLLPALEEEVFSIGPGEIGGPVQVGKEWHIMRVLDVRDAQRESLDEAATSKEARRLYIHDKIAEYTVNLRQNDFNVEVYEDRIIQLAQAEADMVGELAEQAMQPGSVTSQRVEELQKFITPPQRPE